MTDKMIYIAQGIDEAPARLHALRSENGKEIWTKNLISGRVASGSVIDDALYLVIGYHLLALDVRSGKQIWDYEHEILLSPGRDRPISLLASPDHLFTIQRSIEEEHDDYDEYVYRLCSFDKATGKMLWSVKPEGGSAYDNPLTSGKQEVIFFSFTPVWLYGHVLHAVSKQDGRNLWHSALIDNTHFQAMTCT